MKTEPMMILLGLLQILLSGIMFYMGNQTGADLAQQGQAAWGFLAASGFSLVAVFNALVGAKILGLIK